MKACFLVPALIILSGFATAGTVPASRISATHRSSPAATASDNLDPEWVRTFQTRSDHPDDYPSACAVDRFKNVYVAGYTSLMINGTAYATLKYDSLGNLLWRRYLGWVPPAIPSAIGVDWAGNVYVTGHSNGIGGEDYATIKYSPSGDQQWIQYYNGTGNGNDYATAIAVDSAGNVAVTGGSLAGALQGFEIVTIKYSTAGTQLWAAHYMGATTAGHNGRAVAMDDSGSVYVTGETAGTNGDDYITIKYTSSGTQQWVRTYDGPGHRDDYARAIAVDKHGYIYVTGGSPNVVYQEIATIKYNSSGTQQWVGRFSGSYQSGNNANAVSVDTAGNVYVGGYGSDTATGTDFITLKYNTNGVQQWANRFAGTAKYSDVLSRLVLDRNGGITVTGESSWCGTAFFLTVRYSTAGALIWSDTYSGPVTGDNGGAGLAVSPDGDAWVTGYSVGSGTGYDFATIRYGSTGLRIWVERYDGPVNTSTFPMAMAVDDSGNIVVAGYGTGAAPQTTNNYVTVKYTSDGDTLWTRQYDGPASGEDQTHAVAIDHAGNIYVTGYSAGSTGGYDYATVAYGPGGNQLWVSRYNGDGNAQDEAAAIAVDTAGYVYVTGSSDRTGGWLYDIVTLKINRCGGIDWTSRYQSPCGGSGYPHALSIDAAGNVYVAGDSYGGASGLIDYATIKYNNAGVLQWVGRYDGDGHGNDYPYALAIDTAGNVYVGGGAAGLSNSDYALVKYNSSGVQQWVRQYTGSAVTVDHIYGVALDSAGSVYVNGRSASITVPDDYATIRYDNAGNQIWANRVPGIGACAGVATGMTIDQYGNIYTAGVNNINSVLTERIVVKYDSIGTEQWNNRYRYTDTSRNDGALIAADRDGNVYVAGSTSFGMDYINAMTVLKYHQDHAATKFSVDAHAAMGWGKFNPAADSLVLRGSRPPLSWNGAKYILTDPDHDSIYTVVVPFYTPGPLEYKFVIRHSGLDLWELTHGTNRSCTISGGTQALPVFSYDELAAYVPNPGEYSGDTGVIALWHLDEDTLVHANYNQSGRLVLFDASTRGNLALASGTTEIPGQIGMARRFNGTADYADCGPALKPACSDSFTCEAWIRTASVHAGTIFANQRGGGFVFTLNADSTVGFRLTFLGGPAFILNSTIRITPNVWTHCAAAFNRAAKSMTLWIDGVPAGSLDVPDLPLSPGPSGCRPTIGASCDGSGNYSSFFSGDIDEVRLLSTGCTAGKFSIRTITIPLTARWNLLSLPGTVGDARRTALFSGSISRAFRYTDHYVASDSLQRGSGYWMKFPDAGSQTLVCVGVCDMSVPVVTGWNLVGSICEPVDVHAITTVPSGMMTSGFYGYEGRYARTDTLKPGNGYWVKTVSPGVLRMNAGAGGRAESVIRFIAAEEEPPLPPSENGTGESGIPAEYALGKNVPNPFNPSTTITYQLPVESRVTLKIYNLLGQVVAVLVDAELGAGSRSVEWNADASGSGVYFYRMEAHSADGGRNFESVQKMIHLK